MFVSSLEGQSQKGCGGMTGLALWIRHWLT